MCLDALQTIFWCLESRTLCRINNLIQISAPERQLWLALWRTHQSEPALIGGTPGDGLI